MHETERRLLQPAEFANRAQLSAKALRLYAELGLLVPDHVDERTSYRYYSPLQLDRARLISLLRRAGMPLRTVGAVVDLEGPAVVAAIGRWWATVEDDVRVRRELVHYLDRYLTGRHETMFDIQQRATTEQKLLTAERRVTVDGLNDFIETSCGAITAHLDESGVRDRGSLRVMYHGMVTEDSDGPVEVAIPFHGSVEPAGDLRVRLHPAGEEAYTRLTRGEVQFPAILAAYDAVGAWIDERGMTRAGSPAEVYFTGRAMETVSADEPFCDVVWPVTPA